MFFLVLLFAGYRTGSQDYYKHTHGFSGAHTLERGTTFYGFDFWENETAANGYAGQYATHLYVKRTEDLIATHARTKVCNCVLVLTVINLCRWL